MVTKTMGFGIGTDLKPNPVVSQVVWPSARDYISLNVSFFK